jgi:hypothetical protein
MLGLSTTPFSRNLNSYQGTASFLNSYYLLGPHFSLPLEYATLDFRALFGGFSTSGTYNDNTSKVTGTGFAWNLGFGVRYNISEKIAFKFNLDYISSSLNPEITNSTPSNPSPYYYSSYYYSSFYPINENITLASLNLSVGVAYQFVK